MVLKIRGESNTSPLGVSPCPIDPDAVDRRTIVGVDVAANRILDRGDGLRSDGAQATDSALVLFVDPQLRFPPLDPRTLPDVLPGIDRGGEPGGSFETTRHGGNQRAERIRTVSPVADGVVGLV
jgi:hypothetical protein